MRGDDMTERVIASKTVYVDDIYDYVTSKKSEVIEDHSDVYLKAISGSMMHTFFLIKRLNDDTEVFYLSSFPLEGNE